MLVLLSIVLALKAGVLVTRASQKNALKVSHKRFIWQWMVADGAVEQGEMKNSIGEAETWLWDFWYTLTDLDMK